jgi:hypothetical protein
VDERRDEVAGDHEKDVDPDKSAAERRNLKVVEYHGKHCDSAQSVDIGPVRWRRGLPNTQHAFVDYAEQKVPE